MGSPPMETEFGGGRKFVCFGAGADVCANDAGSIASKSKTENHRLFIFTPVAVNNTRAKKIFTGLIKVLSRLGMDSKGLSEAHALSFWTKINHERANAQHHRRQNSHRLGIGKTLAEHWFDVAYGGSAQHADLISKSGKEAA